MCFKLNNATKNSKTKYNKRRDYMKYINNLIHGDCLIKSDKIESESVDLILTDLPYGTMIRSDETHKKMFGEIDKWDLAIEPKRIYEIANRILRKNGKMILFSQEPYTTKLINEAIPNIPFSYRAIWEKDNFAVALGVNKAMVGFYEDILIFSKANPKHDLELNHPIRKWLKETEEKAGIFWNDKRIHQKYVDCGIAKNLSSAIAMAQHKLDWNYVQIQKIDKRHYDALMEFYNFDKTVEEIDFIFTQYQEKHLQEEKDKNPSTFNLWEGNKYKSNILKYKKDYQGLHPTQKPVLLLEDLIKTFSNEGDSIVDLTMGSCSTGIACINTNRNFTGIELDNTYFNISTKRIEDHIENLHSVF